MAAAPHAIRTDPDRTPDGTGRATPALTALLDHLAEELAREYVRLMEHAAREDAAPLTHSLEGS